MLFVREYGNSGPLVIVLHGRPGAPGSMAPVARGLAGSYRVLEPFQRASGEKPVTVATHVEDLYELIAFHAADSPPALLGSSWGAMLALAYAATHPNSTGPLILVGCGTFDLVARARMQDLIRQRMNDDIRKRLETTEQLADEDVRLKATAEALAPLYTYDPIPTQRDEEMVDARAQQETWSDIVRLQSEGVYPAAFTAIKVPVLMVRGTFDPHPGRLIHENLRPLPTSDRIPRVGTVRALPVKEKAAADEFFWLVRAWLGQLVIGHRQT